MRFWDVLVPDYDGTKAENGVNNLQSCSNCSLFKEILTELSPLCYLVYLKWSDIPGFPLSVLVISEIRWSAIQLLAVFMAVIGSLTVITPKVVIYSVTSTSIGTVTTTKIVYGVTIYGVTFKIMTPQGL